MQYASMQTLFDSLCQCLGSSPTLPQDGSDCILHPDQSSPHHNNGGSQTHTPTAADNGSPGPTSRRTSRLELKDKQWDALFEAVNPNMQHIHKHGGESPSSLGGRERATADNDQDSSQNMETARAIAHAKQAANPSRYHMSASGARDSPPPSSTTTAAPKSSIRCTTKSHKRKRPISSRDDIFRSRKLGPSVRRTGCQDSNCMNPISKFLSNHQGFANALCFATPVRDEEDEDDELKEEDPHDGASLASDANTLNTCEDSMMMLDRKLALMSKNQPPMPLFHDFKVNQNEPEGLRRMVEDETHSSANLMNLWRQQRQEGKNPLLDGGNVIVPSSSSGSSGSVGANRGRPRVRYPAPPVIPEDETPPQMKAASSSSGGSSRSSRNAPQIGEI